MERVRMTKPSNHDQGIARKKSKKHTWITILGKERRNEIKARKGYKIRKRNSENTKLIKMIITSYDLSTYIT
jgi:hypothetical protein